MDPANEPPRCANQVYVAMERGAPEPTLLCSCAAGFIHMHDCPVTVGLECVHFTAVADDPPEPLTPQEHEKLHDGLMADYLTRSYHHRIRGLAPEGDAWHRRKEELAKYYAESDEKAPPSGMSDDAYEEERERLIAQRKKREEERRLREERSREERARDRARLGIKTVVEKAREAVDARGNVASSVVDELPAPPPGKKRRRRGRRKPADGPAPRKPAAQGESGPPKDKPPRRKRRRRRRRKKPGGEGSA